MFLNPEYNVAFYVYLDPDDHLGKERWHHLLNHFHTVNAIPSLSVDGTVISVYVEHHRLTQEFLDELIRLEPVRFVYFERKPTFSAAA